LHGDQQRQKYLVLVLVRPGLRRKSSMGVEDGAPAHFQTVADRAARLRSGISQ
jgi:hypothetical protein